MYQALSRWSQKWMATIFIMVVVRYHAQYNSFLQIILWNMCNNNKALFLSPFYWWEHWAQKKLSSPFQISHLGQDANSNFSNPQATHLTSTLPFLSHYLPPAFSLYFHFAQMDGPTALHIMKLPSSLSLHYSWSWITALDCTSSPPPAHTTPISHWARMQSPLALWRWWQNLPVYLSEEP